MKLQSWLNGLMR